MEQYDLMVIGSGPGGYVAAERAGALGKRVLLVEKDQCAPIVDAFRPKACSTVPNSIGTLRRVSASG